MSKREELSSEELEAEVGEDLPVSEAMSPVRANVEAPMNAAVALNALGDDSAAAASAEQNADIDQNT
jgi:hypothetical protein